MKAPFPWFGGKSRVAPLVWDRFGDVRNYVEPFAGSLAVLLARPHDAHIETVNDRDAYLSNFWRAVAASPDEVARHADWPVSEADLHARHVWLLSQSDFRERMLTEPDYFDAKVAGWWVWGLCAWIGSGWCVEREREREREQTVTSAAAPQHIRAGHPTRKLPSVGKSGRGIHAAPPPRGNCRRSRMRAVESTEQREVASTTSSPICLHASAAFASVAGIGAAC